MAFCQLSGAPDRDRHGFQGHGVLYVLCSEWKTVPADASSLIPPALDQFREHPEAVFDEVPRLLGQQVPDPRDPRGVRHALVAVLALTACAVLAGATSVLAVSEWIADAPPHILERLGVRLDPLFPKRFLPGETTVRRLLGRIDGDALNWASDTGSPTDARRRPGCAASQWTAKACAARPKRRAARSTCSRH
ncbi:transposase family protein [Streptomyces buecherae]|uniref:transposase family protein n=1 Tax=Streptomyces buecherae TaxID=2763006 RepID=UPI001E54B981|nr:transposase family protein [Streptomyces buecherae]